MLFKMTPQKNSTTNPNSEILKDLTNQQDEFARGIIIAPSYRELEFRKIYKLCQGEARELGQENSGVRQHRRNQRTTHRIRTHQGEPVSQGVLKTAHSIGCLQIEPTLHETLDADALDKTFQTSGNVNGRIVTQIWDMAAVITPNKVQLYEAKKTPQN